MIVNERIVDFIHALEPERSENLEIIRREALAGYVPIIKDETAALLKCLMTALRPMRILELGTAVGYSALTMAEAMPEGAKILTVEKYEPRIPIARANFVRCGREDCIELIQGDAEEVLQGLVAEEQHFDFIFMDAAKGQYLHWLPDILRLLVPGGMLVSDNILQEGSIVESRYTIVKRDRTIHSRMREYLYQLKHHPQLTTSILPVGDGVAMSAKR